MRATFFIYLTALAGTSTAGAQSNSEWNQWRGPDRDGTLPAKADWPDSLESDTLVEAWSIKLAEGYSSPILSKDHVFTVETKGKEDEITRAISRKNGKQAWEHSWAGSMKVPFFAAKNGSWVRCTPVFDGEHVYVGGMRDVLASINVKTG